MALSSYRVVSPNGVNVGKNYYGVGATLFLTDAGARYLLLNGQVAASAQYTTPTQSPTSPAPITETNTFIDLNIGGLETPTTMQEMINIFPRLQPPKGDKGDIGNTGPVGPVGPVGPSVTINGKNGSTVTLTPADIGLGNVGNLSPANLPISTAAQTALNTKVDKSSVGVAGGVASLDPSLGTVPVGQIPSLELPVSVATQTAIANAISALVSGADSAYDTLSEIEALFKLNDGALASILSAISARLITANNLSELPNKATARTNLGLGSIATSDRNSVQISGGSVDGVTIGSVSPAEGSFTNLRASGTIFGSIQGNANTATRLASARTVTASGDITGSFAFDGSADVPLSLTLPASGVTAGSYGSASSVSVVTFDSKGRATSASTTPILITSSAVTDAASSNTSSTIVKRDASGNFSAGTITANLTGKLTTARTISLTGDFSGSVSFDGSSDVSLSGSLSTSGATAGSYGSPSLIPTITVDSKGRITSISTTAISAGGVTSVAGRSGAVTLSVADVSGAAALASPNLTGTPTAPTATASDNSTKIATTAYADNAGAVAGANAAAGVAVALAIALG